MHGDLFLLLLLLVCAAFALALTRRRPGAYEPGASLPQRRRLLP